MSHVMSCGDAPNCTMDRPGYPNPCRCQTLGEVYLTEAIEESMKKLTHLIGLHGCTVGEKLLLISLVCILYNRYYQNFFYILSVNIVFENLLSVNST